MNKKVLIRVGSGIVVVGLIATGIVLYNLKDKPVDSGNSEYIDNNVSMMEYETPDDEEFIGVPVPDIINRGGTINKVKKNYVVITGPENEDITIYIDKNTEIFGADGSEKKVSDLKVGKYITVDIDAGARNEDDPDDEFDAMIIYISGK